MNMQAAINQVLNRTDFSQAEMTDIMQTIMTGQATPAQIGGFLIGLRLKGETVAEITAAASVMRELASGVVVDENYLVDTCGTGGDSSESFNISTASAFVVAAAGGRVAKHGNRSISSKSGSADVLEAAGVNLDISATQVAECVDKLGVGFMFAPAHHGAMKHAIGPRKEMGVRTIFNLLGPLTNPAGAPNQVIGVFSKSLVEPLAEVLQKLGSRHVLVVHARDGLDEFSIATETDVAELKNGVIEQYSVSPEQFGLVRGSLNDIRADSAASSLQIIRSVFDNHSGAARDIVQLNAGAAIYACGIAGSFASGVELADKVISNGDAKNKLDQLIVMTQGFNA